MTDIRIPVATGELLDKITILRIKSERIADLATNIAEDVIFMVDGEVIRHKPEKYA